jgi:hypothetical protein
MSATPWIRSRSAEGPSLRPQRTSRVQARGSISRHRRRYPRSNRPRSLPVVLSQREVRALLQTYVRSAVVRAPIGESRNNASCCCPCRTSTLCSRYPKSFASWFVVTNGSCSPCSIGPRSRHCRLRADGSPSPSAQGGAPHCSDGTPRGGARRAGRVTRGCSLRWACDHGGTPPRYRCFGGRLHDPWGECTEAS